ncbi:CinA family protein [Demequina iriomotensis]|uniref:CinA family protein n=1 Tax=Demequina iriomotensis TaxID=1536641 RepID=UPI0007803669|nr:CinA family protein [Demequina iriomotensis]
MPRPDEVVDALRERQATLATAESLTGGAVCAALVSVPGASDVIRGGIVAYSATMKAALLGVDPALIAASGVVSEPVALAMARGAREATGATHAVATTGVAGPEPHGGRPAGTVCLAVEGPAGSRALTLELPGDRTAVRAAATEAALALVTAVLDEFVTRS